MTGCSRIAAMIFSSPPQFGQRLSSNSITPSIAARPGSSTDLLQTSRTSVPALGRDYHFKVDADSGQPICQGLNGWSSRR